MKPFMLYIQYSLGTSTSVWNKFSIEDMYIIFSISVL